MTVVFARESPKPVFRGHRRVVSQHLEPTAVPAPCSDEEVSLPNDSVK